MKLFFGFFAVAILFISCSHSFRSNDAKEGCIVYDISYIDSEENNPLISLLPANMTLNFKDNNTITKIEGYLGIFRFSYLCNAKLHQSGTLLQILDKRYIYIDKEGAMGFGYNALDGMQINKTDETKEIIGFKCKKAIVTYNDPTPKTVELYYTDEIAIENPNANNPFKDIDGVLLQFEVKMNNIGMKFKANRLEKIKIKDMEFEIPKGYKKITKEKMAEIMNSFIPHK